MALMTLTKLLSRKSSRTFLLKWCIEIRLREVQYLNAPIPKSGHRQNGAHGVESYDRTETLEVRQPVLGETPSHKTRVLRFRCPVSRVLDFAPRFDRSDFGQESFIAEVPPFPEASYFLVLGFRQCVGLSSRQYLLYV